jgi:cyclopropane-fatty-acyl-phospholipid synthase
MLFATFLRSMIRSGSMVVVDSWGREHRIGDGSPPSQVIRLTRPSLGISLALNPKLLLGEAYADGTLVIEQGSVIGLLTLLARNLDGLPPGHPLNWAAKLPVWRPRIRIKRAQRNVAHHYDLTPEFYDLFLDSDRQYSCAYFTSPVATLEAAQAEKKRRIAAKLLLDRPGLRVLDIGSGWGGLALFLAGDAGADVTGITLSAEQHRESTGRAADAGMADQVRFALRDYRQETGTYDRVVSVGMFEHVGRTSYDAYFATVRGLLSEDGVALLHSVGDSGTPGPINPFIQKHIFPGAAVPSLSEVLAAVERSGLLVTDIEILHLHYAETLLRWRERFVANRAEAVRMQGERFFRMWEFYLAMCEVGFRERTSMVFQMQLTRRKGTTPLTRDYMASRAHPAPARAAA